MKNRFKLFSGENIPDIIEYLKVHIDKEPGITISVGCDSIQKRKRTIYAITIMLYNNEIKNGAHVVFYRESLPKLKDHNERLYKEAIMALEVSEFLNAELGEFYTRQDITLFQRKSYKFHLMKCSGDYNHLTPSDVDRFVTNITLNDLEKNLDYKLVDIHLDFNPFESTEHSRGKTNNKSNAAYKSYVPWLRGLNYRVFAKPASYAATSSADHLLQD